MRKNILKISLVVVLVMALFGLTMTSFAVWDNLTQEQNETIKLGEGTTVTVSPTATVPAGIFLVPSGVAMGANDVNQVVLTYDVTIDKALVAPLGLSVTVSNKKINGLTTYANLVNVDVARSQSTIKSGDIVTVTVTVTLTEPASQAQYEAVKNGVIKFDLTFQAQ